LEGAVLSCFKVQFVHMVERLKWTTKIQADIWKETSRMKCLEQLPSNDWIGRNYGGKNDCGTRYTFLS